MGSPIFGSKIWIPIFESKKNNHPKKSDMKPKMEIKVKALNINPGDILKKKIHSDLGKVGKGDLQISNPDAPCMDYLPTLGEKWLHSRGNVGKYSLHGASGKSYKIKKQ